MQIVLDLPFPPSENHLWGIARGRLVNSAKYKAWKKESDGMFYVQFVRKKRPEPLKNFTVSIVLNERRRIPGVNDSQNYLKAPIDYCQRAGLVRNDADCDGGSWSWGHAPTGCRVVLTGEPAAAKT